MTRALDSQPEGPVAGKSPEPSESPAVAAARPSLLVVDDDPGVRALATDALGEAGFAVETAADGEAALALMETFRPDLILLDVVLPGIDGIALCRHLRAAPETRETPICMMTGLGDLASIQQAFEAGATDFIVKPPSWAILIQRLQYLWRSCLVARELSTANNLLQHEIAERSRTAAALTESEERLRLALMAANQGLYDLNLKTGETVVSPEYARMLGYEPDEFVETDAKFRKRLHDEDRTHVRHAFNEHVSGVREEYRAEFRQKTKAGEWKWIGSLGKVVARDEEGRPLRMLGTHTDITERKVLEHAERDQRQVAEALRDTAAALNSTLHLEEVLDRILDNIEKIAAYDAVIMVMLEGDTARVVRQRGTPLPQPQPQPTVADGRYRLGDLPLLGALLDTGAPCLVADTMADPAFAAGCRMVAGTRSCLGIPLEIRGSVAGAIVLTSASPGHFTAESAQRLRAFASQASVAIENARLFLRAHQLSITDVLTGLNNRRHFFDAAKGEFERIRRYGRALSVVMIDIDHFKQLNDTHGHFVGDAVLREVAQRIQEAVRTIDAVARYGGEEFAVLMPETDLAEALEVAARVCRRVAERPVYNDGTAVFTTISLGVAETGENTASLEDLLKCSDLALYAAKAAGRNCVEAYRTAG